MLKNIGLLGLIKSSLSHFLRERFRDDLPGFSDGIKQEAGVSDIFL